jgi:hypothetical protein
MTTCHCCGSTFEPQKPHHRLCWPCWRRAIPVDVDLVRTAVVLTHPDRHPLERADVANRVTAELLGALQRAGRGLRAMP